MSDVLAICSAAPFGYTLNNGLPTVLSRGSTKSSTLSAARTQLRIHSTVQLFESDTPSHSLARL